MTLDEHLIVNELPKAVPDDKIITCFHIGINYFGTFFFSGFQIV